MILEGIRLTIFVQVHNAWKEEPKKERDFLVLLKLLSISVQLYISQDVLTFQVKYQLLSIILYKVGDNWLRFALTISEEPSSFFLPKILQ